MGPHGPATGSVILTLSLIFAAALLQPSAACPPEERTALLAFKAGITADPRGMLSNWTANGDCCTWGGSFCDSAGHVTEILLIPNPKRNSGNESYFLQGKISPALANLTHLESLDLDSLWQLSGSLPASLGELKNLQTLRVRTNILTGSIPSSYGGLTSLIYFDLANNKLSGDVPPTLGNIGPACIARHGKQHSMGMQALMSLDELLHMSHLFQGMRF